MSWRAADTRTRLLGLALGALFGAYFLLYAIAILGRDEPFRFADFLALWADGLLLAGHPATDLYNPAILPDWQHSVGMDAAVNTPFPYPPIFVPVVRLLGLLPYDLSYAVFMASTLATYLLAIVLPRPRAPLLLLAVAAPSTIITLVAGQTGFLAAGLFLGGLRLATVRPWIGGGLLGLLAFKPQYGLVVPVALVAAGAWRCIHAAVLTVGLLVLLTSAGFGWTIWPVWIAYLPQFSAKFGRESDQLLYLMPTVSALLRTLGATTAVKGSVQLALSLACAIWVWRVCRRGIGPHALLALATAAFLATPYAYVYDLPVLTGPVLLFADHQLRMTGRLTMLEVTALTLALLLPAVLVHAGATLPIGPACLLLLAVALTVHRGPEDPARA
jgi:hypothetical protein